MKKVHATNQPSILDDLRAKRKEVRDDAVTAQEIAAEMLVSRSTATIYANRQVEQGQWRKVWKKVGSQLAPAYVRA